MWINMAYEIVHQFTKPGDTVWSSYGCTIVCTDICLHQEQLRRIQQSTDRAPAFAVAEIAFLVALTSADTNVTLTAAHCLRLLAQAETAPDAPATDGVNEDERAKRYPIYEQLGDPKVMIVGVYVVCAYDAPVDHSHRAYRAPETSAQTDAFDAVNFPSTCCCLGGVLLALVCIERDGRTQGG